MGIVLIHGGGFDRRCWDLLLPELAGPAIAVDLPGRGSNRAPLDQVTFETCADAVAADVDAAGLDEVVLVGHSLAGCSLPAIVGRLGPARVRHVAFVAATVPPGGQACIDTLDAAIRSQARSAASGELRPMDHELARLVLGDDLDDVRFAWCAERLVPEAPRLVLDPVDTAPLEGVRRTWVRTLRDQIVPAEKQARFASALDPCPVVDLDSGHMAMVSRPAELAGILDEISRS